MARAAGRGVVAAVLVAWPVLAAVAWEVRPVVVVWLAPVEPRPPHAPCHVLGAVWAWSATPLPNKTRCGAEPPAPAAMSVRARPNVAPQGAKTSMNV